MANLTPKKFTDNLFKQLGQGAAIYQMQKTIHDLTAFSVAIKKQDAIVYTSLSNANQILFYSKCLIYAKEIMVK